ncbi:MAG: amidinotransferase [Nitrospirales bacterium]
MSPPADHTRPFATPDWSASSGNSQAKPRDVLIVIGNEILEAPMSWHSRYFEFLGYRRLVREYFRRGARWTAAPKPQLIPELYQPGYQRGVEYVTTEVEPVWDAADICRVGKDLFVQRSNVTNLMGIEWLRRHLGDAFTIHMLEFVDDRPMHIDSTFVPLAPGKLMINPDRPCKNLPEMFRKGGWDILEPPPTVHGTVVRSQQWLHLNILMLDERRVIIEKEEEPFARALKDWGFEPILCPFRNNYRFGGSFHCSTVDIRRRGTLQSYF